MTEKTFKKLDIALLIIFPAMAAILALAFRTNLSAGWNFSDTGSLLRNSCFGSV